MSERILASPWFLGTTAVVAGGTTAVTSWLADESSDGVRLLAVLIGVGIALVVMLLVAWAMTPDAAPAVETAETIEPPTVTTLDLDAPLANGRALLQDLEAGTTDARVGAWI